MRDFEWLVVDDGSTDNSAALVDEWAKRGEFPIRYVRQLHAGKHIAFNLAARQAQGELLAPVDSDDELQPGGLERLREIWEAIPQPQRMTFSGIGGLCHDQRGVLIGDRFPTSPFDVSFSDLIYRYRIRGEKWGVTRTDIFRQYPFPEVAGTEFVPEGLVGLQISKAYKRRYVNEVFRIYYQHEYHEPGKNLSKRANLGANASGRFPYYLWLLNEEIHYFWRSPMPFIKAAIMLPIAARASGRSLRQAIRSVKGIPAKAIVLLGLPAAAVLSATEWPTSAVRQGEKVSPP